MEGNRDGLMDVESGLKMKWMVDGPQHMAQVGIYLPLQRKINEVLDI